ncbi:MutS-related protein [Aquimarina agarilytica]|uniref:MutS-related protein n=1 Tax=Aquimarina agarilytica TaxID=1087449 RepID=UPI00028A2F68|nr:hypothetical protein [Aquimarina agarilytica]
MITYVLFQLQKHYAQITTSKKQRIEKRLKASFGTIKEDDFDFNLIEKYFRNKDNSKAYQVLSDRTCNDLDIDDLFAFIDRTHSKVGQQYLYHKLRTITINKEQTELDEIIIDELLKNESLRISLQKQIKKLNKRDAFNIGMLFQEAHILPPKWFFMVKILSFASILSGILSFFEPFFFIISIGIFCVNFVVHFWNKKNLFQYVSSIPQLINLNDLAAYLSSNSLLKKINPNVLTSIKLVNTIKNRSLFFKFEATLQSDTAMLFWLLFEIFKVLFLLEPLLLFGILKRVDTKRTEIEAVFSFVGHVDMLLSIASLRSGLDSYCLPTIHDANHITATEIKHPLIFNCKANSVTIAKKSVLLTGSNMSGKTSFIRAIGVNIITGLTINTCFAESLSFPVLTIFSAIRISDDLLNDKSYYFQEVLTIKEMISESYSNKRSLFLLDELFKGTNTVERISAGKAILSTLTKNNNIVLVSTHDIELTDMLLNEYELYHFSETLSDTTKSVGFDYKLKTGKLKNRNAIKILEINDYPKEIINEAIAISKTLDETYV